MYNCNLIVLSYHRFTAEDHPYPFSRTYKQFRNDLQTKDFDWITIDDGHASIIKACKMMQDSNIRAKLFIATSLIGAPGYCTWDDLWKLSKFHDIENHSHNHQILTELDSKTIYWNISKAVREIKRHIRVRPRYFVPPYNTADSRVESIVRHLGLQMVKDRIDIRNDSR